MSESAENEKSPESAVLLAEVAQLKFEVRTYFTADVPAMKSNDARKGREMINNGPILISSSGALSKHASTDERGPAPTHPSSECTDIAEGDRYVRMPCTTGSARRELFGGAMHADIPICFSDISTFRQVPDNQEVYLDVDTNVCVSVEVFALADEVAGDTVAGHYFEDTALCNEALTSSLLRKEVVVCSGVVSSLLSIDANKSFSMSSAAGVQSVRKGRSPSTPADEVLVLLFVLRMPTVTTDLVVCLNVPLSGPDAASESMGWVRDAVCGSRSLGELLSCPSPLEIESREENSSNPLQTMRGLLHSLSIDNWALFA